MRPSAENPVVVSILTINQSQLLADCLESLFENEPAVPYLVHVFDQASTDGTAAVLASFEGRHPGRIVSYRHPENIGFVLANNIVFGRYPGSDVVVLNDDTVLLPGWLDALAERAYAEPDIGVVGARLVYPNGVLQEAGGEIFRDGSGQNIGKWDDPARPEYLVPKDVQYCSGALLYIRREVLDRCGGGFDPQLAPAYYEDTDLCFAARAAGFRVVYEPASVIIHREGATNGVDLKQGVKRWQEVNRHTFTRKWAHVLQHHRRGMWEHPDPPRGKHVLVVHLMPPLFDQASGDRRLYEMLLALNVENRVTFLAVDDRGLTRYTDHLRRKGLHAVANDVGRWPAYGRAGDRPPRCATLEELVAQNDFDLAILEFYHQARVYLDDLRRLAPRTPVVVDSVDVHFLRERREAALHDDPALVWRAERTFRDELSVYERADGVLTVTERDGDALREVSPDLDVRVVPNLHDVVEQVAPREGRSGLVFVGGFRHPPNVDAALWLAAEILPRVRRELPGTTLTLAGSDPPPEVRDLAGAGIAVTGFVADLEPLLDRHLVSIAPLRFGAGMKGKIAEALGRGLPVVTTTCGAEGMDLVDGVHALLGDDPDVLAAAGVRLLRDGALWERLSRAGREHVAARWSVPVVARMLDELLARPPVAAARESTRHRVPDAAPVPTRAPDGTLGVIMFGTGPVCTGRSLGQLAAATGRPLDAVVCVPQAGVADWDAAAARDGYRIALVRPDDDLGTTLDRVAPAVAGDDVLLVEDRLVLFRNAVNGLFAELDRDPGLVAVRPAAIPVAPVSAVCPDEPWDIAAARACAPTAAGGHAAGVVLVRRGRLAGPLSSALALVHTCPELRVVDPALPPSAPSCSGAPRSGMTLVLIDDAGGPPRRVPAMDGVDVVTLHRPGPPLGALLAKVVSRTRRQVLLVVDRRIEILPRHLGALARKVLGSDAGAVLLNARGQRVGADTAWREDLATRSLAADVPRALPLFGALRVALCFRDPHARLFDPALDGFEALSEAVLRSGGSPRAHGESGALTLPAAAAPGVSEALSFVGQGADALARLNRRVDRLEADARYAGLYRFAEAGAAAEDLLVEALDRLASAPQQDQTWHDGTLLAQLLLTIAQIRTARAVLPILASSITAARQRQLLAAAGLAARTWPREASAGARGVLSLVCRLTGDPAGARELARQAVAEGPEQRLALFAHAQAELGAGEVATAEAALREVRRLSCGRVPVEIFPGGPVFARALMLEAALAAKRGAGELTELIAACEAVHVRPGGPLGARMLELEAEALARSGRSEDAARRALDARALHPRVADRALRTLDAPAEEVTA